MRHHIQGSTRASKAAAPLPTDQLEWDAHPQTQQLKGAEAKLRTQLSAAEAQLQQVVEENRLLQRLNTSLNACALGHSERSLSPAPWPGASEHTCTVARVARLPPGVSPPPCSPNTAAGAVTGGLHPPAFGLVSDQQQSAPAPSTAAQAPRQRWLRRTMHLIRRLATQVILCSLAVALSHTEQGHAWVAAVRGHPAARRVAAAGRALRQRVAANNHGVQQDSNPGQPSAGEQVPPCQQEAVLPVADETLQEAAAAVAPSAPAAPAVGDVQDAVVAVSSSE